MINNDFYIFVLLIYRIQKRGTYLEAGAKDGEYKSKTLYLERALGWKGILIESDPDLYTRLLTKNRRAYSLAGCIAKKPWPYTAKFKQTLHKNYKAGKSDDVENSTVEVDCYPLVNILQTINMTRLDALILDVQGSELSIMRTIQWDLVDIIVR
jgi:FkbM family methyltransferase